MAEQAFPFLPASLTHLVGRDEACQSICSLLSRHEIRLLTLSGTGGVGKTSLGFAVAQKLHEIFEDGVVFVSLSSIRDPDLVLLAIAERLALKQDQSPVFERLQRALGDKRLLLLLDNFEQVITAGPHLVALLARCPGLKLLVTSRERLQVSGEYCWLVPPLPAPDFDGSIALAIRTQQPAIALFVERVQAVQRGFCLTEENWQVIAQICKTLDGLPLALELAAAHCEVLTPQVLLARLSHRLTVLTRGRRDAPSRQQTLRKTLEWSYDLLSPLEQTLFCRVCVFSGNFTVQAIEGLTVHMGETPTHVLDGIASLLDKNLLFCQSQMQEQARLQMLGTIREFGLECLQNCQELMLVKRAHVQYYLKWTQSAQHALFGQKQAQVMHEFVQEQSNIRAAIQCVIELHDVATALLFATALGPFWLAWGFLAQFQFLQEGKQFLDWVLIQCPQKESQAYAHILSVYGSILALLGQPNLGESNCRKAQELLRRQKAIPDLINSFWMLVHILLAEGDFRTANESAREMVALARASNECGTWGETAWALGYSLYLAGNCAFAQGHYEEARSHLLESLTLFMQAGNSFFILLAQLCLGRIALEVGEKEKAGEQLEQVMRTGKQLGLHSLVAEAYYSLADLTRRTGDAVEARHLLLESVRLHQEVGRQQGIAWTHILLARVQIVLGDLKEAQRLLEASWEQGEKIHSRDLIAACLFAQGHLAVVQGQLVWAIRLLGAAEAQREAIGSMLHSEDQQMYEKDRKKLQEVLGDACFQKAWKEGQSLSAKLVMLAREDHLTETLRRRSRAAEFGLTLREKDVLSLLCTGLTNAQIAQQLVLSTVTVNSYLRSIYQKLNVTSRTQAMRRVMDEHLL
jgi:predicted ATPase/DNA-binding CsgD family transcriptional regulator